MISYSVDKRTQEIGIRIAQGARNRRSATRVGPIHATNSRRHRARTRSSVWHSQAAYFEFEEPSKSLYICSLMLSESTSKNSWSGFTGELLTVLERTIRWRQRSSSVVSPADRINARNETSSICLVNAELLVNSLYSLLHGLTAEAQRQTPYFVRRNDINAHRQLAPNRFIRIFLISSIRSRP